MHNASTKQRLAALRRRLGIFTGWQPRWVRERRKRLARLEEALRGETTVGPPPPAPAGEAATEIVLAPLAETELAPPTPVEAPLVATAPRASSPAPQARSGPVAPRAGAATARVSTASAVLAAAPSVRRDRRFQLTLAVALAVAVIAGGCSCSRGARRRPPPRRPPGRPASSARPDATPSSRRRRHPKPTPRALVLLRPWRSTAATPSGTSPRSTSGTRCAGRSSTPRTRRRSTTRISSSRGSSSGFRASPACSCRAAASRQRSVEELSTPLHFSSAGVRVVNALDPLTFPGRIPGHPLRLSAAGAPGPPWGRRARRRQSVRNSCAMRRGRGSACRWPRACDGEGM